MVRYAHEATDPDLSFSFESPNASLVRGPDTEPWWVAAEVRRVLTIVNVGAAPDRLDDDERDTVILNEGTPGNPLRSVVHESGPNEPIFRSRKPSARQFWRWIMSKVLPWIGATGPYAVARAETDRVAAFSHLDPMLHTARPLRRQATVGGRRPLPYPVDQDCRDGRLAGPREPAGYQFN